jgi:hypothetical protein
MKRGLGHPVTKAQRVVKRHRAAAEFFAKRRARADFVAFDRLVRRDEGELPSDRDGVD